ncbi:MAG: hypothetical protein UY41_C0050G0006 [Candidatus Moranbacteria bacterium GW2011_GWE1_49_15]|nr:MAG: hypothetical protein UX75_C0054G0006 [Candidatus Moranbacteria bacterium GW2011_GWE2_47_10]KKW05482.1 MAG: hypothetical protein UY41_C0050G0006 [Candidatus Moranbacteria bacterium GW2011_GWE1_49_15]HBP01225.1 hypothetical protein [Candidatus Moranbacteria bacterium]
MITKGEFRTYIAITTMVFSFAILSGYMAAVNSPEKSRIIVDSFFGNLDFTRNFSPLLIFVFIFLNNLLKALFVIVFGFFFAIVPLVFIYTNGELIGLIIGVFQRENSLFMIVLGLLPHGILEIPAIILATSYGIWLGNCFYRRLKYKEPFRVHFSFAMKKFFKVILPLLFLAAVIESFVTPVVINYLFSR